MSKKVKPKKKTKPKQLSPKNLKRLKALGDRLKSVRGKRTLKDISYPIGKEPQSLSRLENGKINPSYLYLLDVAESLNIDISELIKGLEK